MKDLFIFFKVIIFLAYFRGLRHVELMDLQIEKMVKKNDGMLVTQCNFFYISFSTTLSRHSSIIIQQSSVKSMADKLQGPSNQVEKNRD